MKKDFVFKICVLFAITTLFAYAGTGGSEVNSWYADISNALKGTWGENSCSCIFRFNYYSF